ncbi:uncharacterized protein LOC133307067 [Gastrolobium bilobum]|uniref:uncharacterized protein LOC133307067 n=1 Tax=Gastrolobium bilobum TaxID=150636 RepID=UPI002AB1F7D8|nr:uncharacterized protein LOC133307067 [Gastrolobium bilobum]
MGNCCGTSFDSTHVPMAKVVVHDERLLEFSYRVKVSYLLQMYPTCFICDSDQMGFDDVVKAVHEDEVLTPDQLYFALPLTRLKRPLLAEEMVALAVKAALALAKIGGVGGDKCGSRRKQIMFFSGEGNAKPCRKVALEYGGAGAPIDSSRKGNSRSSGGGRRGRRKFTPVLSSIPEQECIY